MSPSPPSPLDGVRLRLADAAAAPIRGALLTLTDPVLRRRLGALALLNSAAAVLVILLVGWGGWAATEWLVQGEGARVWIGWLARLLGLFGLLLLAPALFNGLAGLVLPMLHERLFLAARERSGGAPVAERSGSALRDAAGELRRVGRLGVLAVAPLPLLLVPVVGAVAYGLIQALNGAWVLGWDLLALHFSLHGVPYHEQRRFLARNRLAVLALGAVAGVLALIPVLQLLFVTTNVVGAGVLSAALDRREHR